MFTSTGIRHATSTVHRRALERTVETLLAIGDKPISIDSLAELCDYSYVHMNRILIRLENQAVIRRTGGRRGVPYQHSVDYPNAFLRGLIDEQTYEAWKDQHAA